MNSTINSVCTVDSVKGNRLILEVIPNNLRNRDLQFYYLGKDNKEIRYVNFQRFTEQLEENLSKNRTFYITFCGISCKDRSIPEYLYLSFNGNNVEYGGGERNGKSVFLHFNFNKSGRTLEQELCSLFTDNVGVFVQSYN